MRQKMKLWIKTNSKIVAILELTINVTDGNSVECFLDVKIFEFESILHIRSIHILQMMLAEAPWLTTDLLRRVELLKALLGQLLRELPTVT